jgi:hypothetical protein
MMVSDRCDFFRHKADAIDLFANAGVMRGRLDRREWEIVAANAVTPMFAKRDMAKKGYCVVTETTGDGARRWYR